MPWIPCVVLALTVFLWNFLRSGHPKNFPQGPGISLPIIGTSHYLAGRHALENLRRKYGDVVGIWLGSKRAVFISGYELIKEVSQHEHCQDRQMYKVPTKGPFVLDGTHPGVISSEGQTWAEQRRFMLQNLRDFGFGRPAMEDLLEEEAGMLLDHLEGQGMNPVDVRDELGISTINTLWKIVTGERIGRFGDEKIKIVCRLVKETMNPVGFLVLDNSFVRGLNRLFRFCRLQECFQDLSDFVSQQIESHRRTFQADSLRDFTDAYIKQMLDKSESSVYSSFAGKDGESNFKSSMVDLFLGGSETTSTTLYWALLHMVLNPKVQKQVQEELDRVSTLNGRLPRYSERSSTPFTEAVITETQRIANVARLSVPHVNNNADVTLGNGKYFLPKGTLIFLNMGSVMLDPKVFPEPCKFDPSRFLGKDRNFEPHPHVLPFGLGRRRCLGEGLAKPSIYMFFTRILSKFILQPENPDNLPSATPILGGVCYPKPFKIKFEARY